MKGFVWYSTSWAQNTYGVTGCLLERGFERYVEVAQATIRVAIRPHAPHDGRASRGSDWRYGFNVLELQFSYAAPSDSDPRPRPRRSTGCKSNRRLGPRAAGRQVFAVVALATSW